MDSNKIATMWFDGPLRQVDYVCVKSMVEQGMDVNLYTFGDVPNAPKGVKVHDGSSILSPKLLDRLVLIRRKHHTGLPVSHFSDFFRVMMQKHSAGMWLDTDTLLFRPFTYPTERPYFAKEDRFRVSSVVWYLPPDNPIIGEYERLMAQDVLMPNWLGFKRGTLKPLLYRLQGQDFAPSDLGITIYGNEGFTRLLKRHQMYHMAHQKHLFFHWAARENEKVFRQEDYSFFLNDPRYLGLHIHRKGSIPASPVKGSLWEWMLERYA